MRGILQTFVARMLMQLHPCSTQDHKLRSGSGGLELSVRAEPLTRILCIATAELSQIWHQDKCSSGEWEYRGVPA